MTKTLLITNDYPPRPGGIQSYLETYLSHLDPAEVAVLASTFRGAESAEYDASKPYLVERVPTEMLLPTPDLAARARRLASDFGATTIWFGEYPLSSNHWYPAMASSPAAGNRCSGPSR